MTTGEAGEEKLIGLKVEVSVGIGMRIGSLKEHPTKVREKYKINKTINIRTFMPVFCWEDDLALPDTFQKFPLGISLVLHTVLPVLTSTTLTVLSVKVLAIAIFVPSGLKAIFPQP